MFAQRRNEIEQDEREIVQPFDEDDAEKTVHEWNADPERIIQQQVDRAVAAEQQLQRHRADERRHHERQHAQRLHQCRATEFEAHRQVGERHRDQAREDDGSPSATTRLLTNASRMIESERNALM